MPYAAGSHCFSSVGEAVAVAMAQSLPAVDQATFRLIGWEALTARAVLYRSNQDGSGSLVQASLPQCGLVDQSLPLVVNGNSISLPIKSYGADAGVYAMTAYPGSDYAQMPADVPAVAGFVGVGFSTVVGLYLFSYVCGQIIDLIRHVK